MVPSHFDKKKIILTILTISRFIGGEINACYNAVDRHVEEGNGAKVALIHDSPLTGTIRKVTYAELLDKVLYRRVNST